MTRRVYAHQGDWVTCENGCHICQFAETVYFGEQMNLEMQLHMWHQPAPQVGQFPVPKCECGGVWIGAAGMNFHFKDGWR